MEVLISQEILFLQNGSISRDKTLGNILKFKLFLFFPGFSLQDMFPVIVHGKSAYNTDVLRTAFSHIFEINVSEALH